MRLSRNFRRSVVGTLVSLILWLGMGPGSPAWALSLSEEKALGRKAFERIRSHLSMVEDGELVGYLQSVANRIAEHLDGSFYQFQLSIINSNVPNAFAIPGGYVFLYRGLIDLMDNESELASIISHEMAHVEARHIARRMEESKIISIATMAGILAAVFLGGGGKASSALAIGTMAGAQTLQLEYSRENEEEADRLGFGYLDAAGYRTQNMVTIMQTISRTRFQADSRIPSYLSSHPLLGERIHYLQMLVDKERKLKDKPAQPPSQGDFPLLKAALISDYEEPHVARQKLLTMGAQKDLDLAATYGLARLDLRLNQAEQALQKLRQVVIQRPNSPMVLGSMGAAYFQMGRLEEARKVLKSALVINPNAVNVHYRLALVLRDMGKIDEALEHLYRAERMAPMMPEIDYQLGVVLGQKNDLGRAHYHLGSYYRQRKDIKLAIFHYEKASNLLSTVPTKKAEVDEALRDLKGEKARQDNEKAEKDKIRKPLPLDAGIGWMRSSPAVP